MAGYSCWGGGRASMFCVGLQWRVHPVPPKVQVDREWTRQGTPAEPTNPALTEGNWLSLFTFCQCAGQSVQRQLSLICTLSGELQSVGPKLCLLAQSLSEWGIATLDHWTASRPGLNPPVSPTELLNELV